MIDTVFIVGPTGIGKTEYAINYALANNGEVVSADSMQIYKYLNIGSAKPTKDEMRGVAHHLIDFVDPREDFSVYEYKKLAIDAIEDIHSRGKLPIVCGGTGLYVNALLYDMDFSAPEGDQQYRNAIFEEEGGDSQKLHERLKKLDPQAAETIHPNNVKRVLRAIERLEKGEKQLSSFASISKDLGKLNCSIYNLSMDRQKLYDRINLRVDKMYENGLVDEVRSLMEMGFTQDQVAMKGIGYKEIMDSLCAGFSAEDAKEIIKLNTRHYAKRQMTWFRRYENASIIEME